MITIIVEKNYWYC